eukprot:g1607.t1
MKEEIKSATTENSEKKKNSPDENESQYAKSSKKQPLGAIRIDLDDGDAAHFGMVSVHLNARCRGIGQGLVKAAEHYTVQNGYAALRMPVLSIVPRLFGWYEKQGYKKTGEIGKFPAPEIVLPQYHIDLVWMEKKFQKQ